mmetsp:Transcript_11342/g.30559  ORF Transcript_11342/g.30559 Transcript_11342/m.30559 type:complete len:323 (+) Transcript_11342:192-1160(+)
MSGAAFALAAGARVFKAAAAAAANAAKAAAGTTRRRAVRSAGVRSAGVRMLNRRREKQEQMNSDLESGVVRRPGEGSLQGRFAVFGRSFETEMGELDALGGADVFRMRARGVAAGPRLDEEFDDFGPVRDGLPRTEPEDDEDDKRRHAWSRRSEAAKRRWADPKYRKKILEKRRAKMMAARTKNAPRVRIDTTDSVTLSSDEKAAKLDRYVRSNQLRAEARRRYLHDQHEWMRARLADGAPARLRRDDPDFLRERQRQRSLIARRRHQLKLARSAAAEDAQLSDHADDDHHNCADGSSSSSSNDDDNVGDNDNDTCVSAASV